MFEFTETFQFSFSIRNLTKNKKWDLLIRRFEKKNLNVERFRE